MAEAIEDRFPQSQVTFIGTKRGIESWLVPARGYEIDYIAIGGFLGKGWVQKLLFPGQLMISVLQSYGHLKRRRPEAVLGTGGYVSAPPVIAAKLLGIPTALLALDAMPSKAVRMLSRIAGEIYAGFPECAGFIKSRGKVIFTGNPLRRDLGTYARDQGAKAFGLDPGRKTILAYGGSRGAHSINLAMARAIVFRGDGWAELQFIIQTGAQDCDWVKKEVAAARAKVVVLPYIEDMGLAFAACDLVISRSGSTVSEILACGLPSILIPYPYAASNHQEYNARSLNLAGAAVMIQDEKLTPEGLAAEIDGIMGDQDRRRTMSLKAKSLARPDAAREIAERLGRLIKR